MRLAAQHPAESGASIARYAVTPNTPGQDRRSIPDKLRTVTQPEPGEGSNRIDAGGHHAGYRTSLRLIFAAPRRTAAGILFWGGLLAFASAAEPVMRFSQKNVREAVKAVVAAQLGALQAGQFEAAYVFAARGIRAQFDVRLFGQLMKRGYAPLLQHQQADLGIVRDNGAGTAELLVTVADRLKRSTRYHYWLVNEAAGWRISGVVLEPQPPPGDT